MTNFTFDENIGSLKPSRIVVTDAANKENARKIAVWLIAAIFLIIIFDGSVRKYILPELESYANFLRDPFVAWLYVIALANGFIKRHWILAVGLFLAAVAGVLTILQVLAGSTAPVSLLVFGFRQYFSLIPLPFIMVKVLQQEDLDWLFRLALWVLIAMAPLMVLQVLSPPDAWVNVGRGLDVERFGLLSYGDFVRPPGFFTAALGPGYFLPYCAAILLSCWMLPRDRRPCSLRLFLLASASLCIALGVSGNRTAIMHVLVVIFASIPAAIVMVRNSRTTLKGTIGIVLSCVAGLTITILLFPDQYQAISERWAGANAIHDMEHGVSYGYLAILSRAVRDMLQFIEVIPATPLVGFGLGLGSNAATILYAADSFLPPAEPPLSRHIIDLGPLVGVLFIAFRIIVATWLGIIAWRTSRRQLDPRAWLLYSVTGALVLTAFMVAQSMASGLIWFWIGLILATAAQKPWRADDGQRRQLNLRHAI